MPENPPIKSVAPTIAPKPVVDTTNYVELLERASKSLIEQWQGKPGHNPFLFIAKHVYPITLKMQTGMPLSDADKAFIKSEWPAPKV